MRHFILAFAVLYFAQTAKSEVVLTILKSDGKVYWTEHFNSQADGDRWLAEERTRKYWNATYTASFVDTTPAPPSASEIAAADSKKTARVAAISALKNFDKTKVKDLGDALDVLEKIVKAQGLDQ